MNSSQPVLLRDAVQSFVREFGILAATRTPCGQPMPVSEAHALVLLAADEGEECLTACEMADYLRIDKSNVSRMCVRMEKAGTIVCVPCEHDGRIKRIQLTRKGVRLASTIEAASRKKFKAVVQALPRSSSPAVIKALHQLTAAIREMTDR